MSEQKKELSWGQTTWRFLAIIIAVLFATLVPGDNANTNVIGTVVLIVLLAIPTAVLAYVTDIRSG